MSDPTKILVLGILVVLTILILLGIAVCVVRLIREEKPTQKKRRRKKSAKREEDEEAFLKNLTILLGVAVLVSLLYFVVRVVWLFLVAHLWIVWVVLIGFGLWAAIRTYQDEDAPLWVKIVGVLFAIAMVAGAFYGLYVAVVFLVKATVIAVTVVVSWVAKYWLVVLVGVVILVVAAGALQGTSGSEKSRSSSSSNDDWGIDPRSREEIENDERHHNMFVWGNEDGSSGVVSDFFDNFFGL